MFGRMIEGRWNYGIKNLDGVEWKNFGKRTDAGYREVRVGCYGYTALCVNVGNNFGRWSVGSGWVGDAISQNVAFFGGDFASRNKENWQFFFGDYFFCLMIAGHSIVIGNGQDADIFFQTIRKQITRRNAAFIKVRNFEHKKCLKCVTVKLCASGKSGNHTSHNYIYDG